MVIKMRNRSKKIGFFTAALLSILLLCGLQASAATLSLEGQKIEGTELYSGQVTVIAQLDAAAGQNLWIRDPNGWMLVAQEV